MAIVNVGLIFTKYEKAKFYKSELETTLKPFKDKGEQIAAEMKKYAKPLQEKTVTDPKLKEQYEQYLLKLKRDMEDLDMQARKLIGKKQEDQIVTLYKEVVGAHSGRGQVAGIPIGPGLWPADRRRPLFVREHQSPDARDGPGLRYSALHHAGGGRYIPGRRDHVQRSLPRDGGAAAQSRRDDFAAKIT